MIVFDTETTGLLLHPDAELAKQPKIIEWGGALLDEYGEVFDTYNTLINPGEEISAEITKITGITNDDVHDAPTFEQAWPNIQSFYARSVKMLSHNLPFDKGMVENELRRLGIVDFKFPLVEICTVSLYRESWGRNPKLTELYEAVVGEKLAQTHRALDDVMALVKIIQVERLWEL